MCCWVVVLDPGGEYFGRESRNNVYACVHMHARMCVCKCVYKQTCICLHSRSEFIRNLDKACVYFCKEKVLSLLQRMKVMSPLVVEKGARWHSFSMLLLVNQRLVAGLCQLCPHVLQHAGSTLAQYLPSPLTA